MFSEKKFKTLLPTLLITSSLAFIGCSDDDKETQTTLVRVIHSSYDAPSVNVSIDGTNTISDLAFLSSSGYTSVNAGSRNINVSDLINTDLNFDANNSYSIFAVNQLSSLEAVLVQDVREENPDKVKIRFFHSAPDAPAVDIKLNDGNGTVVFENSSFKNVSDYVEIDGGSYTFAVTATGQTDEVVVFQPIDVTNGSVYTVMAHGTLDSSDSFEFGARVFVDNGNGNDSVDLVAVPKEKANIRVIHTSYDAPNVDVWVDGNVAISDLAYGVSSGFATVDAGTRNIQVSPTGATSPIVIDSDLTLENEKDYTVLAVGDLANITATFSEDLRTPNNDKVKIRFVHASPDAPAVDIKLNNGNGAAVFENVAFKDIESYVEVDGGSFTFAVTATGQTDEVVIFQPIDLTNGSVLTVVAHGTLDATDSYDFAVRAFVDNDNGSNFVDLTPAPEEANIRVIHASYDAPNVDVWVDGIVAISDLGFGLSSGYATLDAGTRNVQVSPTGATTPIVIDADLDLTKDSEYTVFAVEQLSAIEAVFVEDLREPNSSQVKIRFVHASPDAPAVDIKLNDGNGSVVFGNAAFKDVSDYTEVPGGDYIFAVTAAGQTDEVVRFESVNVADGSVLTVMAHGTLDDTDSYPFGVRVFVDNDAGDGFLDLVPDAGESNVRVIHTSYDAPNVDVWVDGSVAISDLAYGESSGYATLDSGTRNVQVSPTGSTTPIVIDADLPLERDTDYTVFAVNQLSAIDAVFIEDMIAEVTDKVKIRFVHASPDAPAVDIKLDNGNGMTVFSDVEFKEVESYIEIDGGDYTFAVTAAGATNEVVIFNPVNITNGSVLTVVAHGTLDPNDSFDFAARVFVDNGDGDTFLDLTPATSNILVVHTSPDAPAVDLLVDDAVIGMLQFAENTNYIGTPSKTTNIKVNVSGTSNTVIDADLNFKPSKNYSIFAIDSVANISALVLEDNLAAPPAGKAHVRFIHLSPDAPVVDVTLTDGTMIFNNYAFSNHSDFTPLDAGTYNLEVRVAGTTTVALPLNGIQFDDGKIYTVYAKGFLNGMGAQALGAEIIENN